MALSADLVEQLMIAREQMANSAPMMREIIEVGCRLSDKLCEMADAKKMFETTSEIGGGITRTKLQEMAEESRRIRDMYAPRCRTTGVGSSSEIGEDVGSGKQQNGTKTRVEEPQKSQKAMNDSNATNIPTIVELLKIGEDGDPENKQSGTETRVEGLKHIGEDGDSGKEQSGTKIGVEGQKCQNAINNLIDFEPAPIFEFQFARKTTAKETAATSEVAMSDLSDFEPDPIFEFQFARKTTAKETTATAGSSMVAMSDLFDFEPDPIFEFQFARKTTAKETTAKETTATAGSSMAAMSDLFDFEPAPIFEFQFAQKTTAKENTATAGSSEIGEDGGFGKQQSGTKTRVEEFQKSQKAMNESNAANIPTIAQLLKLAPIIESKIGVDGDYGKEQCGTKTRVEGLKHIGEDGDSENEQSDTRTGVGRQKRRKTMNGLIDVEPAPMFEFAQKIIVDEHTATVAAGSSEIGEDVGFGKQQSGTKTRVEEPQKSQKGMNESNATNIPTIAELPQQAPIVESKIGEDGDSGKEQCGTKTGVEGLKHIGEDGDSENEQSDTRTGVEGQKRWKTMNDLIDFEPASMFEFAQKIIVDENTATVAAGSSEIGEDVGFGKQQSGTKTRVEEPQKSQKGMNESNATNIPTIAELPQQAPIVESKIGEDGDSGKEHSGTKTGVEGQKLQKAMNVVIDFEPAPNITFAQETAPKTTATVAAGSSQVCQPMTGIAAADSSQLREENRRLEAESRRFREENQRLEAENVQLREENSKVCRHAVDSSPQNGMQDGSSRGTTIQCNKCQMLQERFATITNLFEMLKVDTVNNISILMEETNSLRNLNSELKSNYMNHLRQKEEEISKLSQELELLRTSQPPGGEPVSFGLKRKRSMSGLIETNEVLMEETCGAGSEPKRAKKVSKSRRAKAAETGSPRYFLRSCVSKGGASGTRRSASVDRTSSRLKKSTRNSGKITRRAARGSSSKGKENASFGLKRKRRMGGLIETNEVLMEEICGATCEPKRAKKASKFGRAHVTEARPPRYFLRSCVSKAGAAGMSDAVDETSSRLKGLVDVMIDTDSLEQRQRCSKRRHDYGVTVDVDLVDIEVRLDYHDTRSKRRRQDA